MRRIALYSDIHANIHALEAVLADIAETRIEERYCLGDLVGYGAHPREVVARVRSASDPVIRGNYDDGVGKRLGHCGCYYPTPEAKADGVASYEFTDRALDEDEHAYLAALPDEFRLEADGVRVLLCHGSPRRINEYLMPDRPDSNLVKLAEAADSDVVCVGHIHVPYHRMLTGTDGRALHYVSDGSVGRPKDGDPRACWAELVFGAEAEAGALREQGFSVGIAGVPGADAEWLGVAFHRVRYDVDAAARDVRAAGLPARLADALSTG